MVEKNIKEEFHRKLFDYGLYFRVKTYVNTQSVYDETYNVNGSLWFKGFWFNEDIRIGLHCEDA